MEYITEFEDDILFDKKRLWDIPESIRRSALCRSLYVYAFRVDRACRNKNWRQGSERFNEDYRFLKAEILSASNAEQKKVLVDAFEYFIKAACMEDFLY